MDDTAASVYSEAKGEYTKQLTLFLVPAFHRFFMSCLHQASQEEPQAKRQLWKFQELLSQIPEWNIDKVQRETHRIQGEIQCDYLEELVTAVFIAHTKVLTAIRIGNKNKRVQITIPKLDHFLHRALSECSRLLWSSAYLFHNELSPIEKQKNHRQVEQLLHEGIAQAIRGLLPVKNILKDYLAEPSDHEGDEDADDEGEDEKSEEKTEKKEDVSKVSEKEEAIETVPVESSAESEQAPAATEVTETSNEVAVQPVIQIDEPKQEPELVQEPITLGEPPQDVLIKEVPIVKEPTVAAPESVPAALPAIEVPTTPTTPTIPTTLVVDTTPTVSFTNYNSVVRTNGQQTSISYEHTDHEPPADEDVEFLDDQGEPLSDFEVLEGDSESLDGDDFETL